MRLISVKHTGVFANLKVLVVLAACLHLQGEEREERKMCSLCQHSIVPRSVVGKEMKGFF